jgi:putative phage-type endonuclease
MSRRYMKRPESYAEWLAGRHAYIGASEMPLLSGHNPYASKDKLLDLWRSKVYPLSLEEAQRLARDAESRVDRLTIGRLIEDVIARLFEIDSGFSVREDKKIWFDPEKPFLACNLDRRIVGKPWGVECKNTRSSMLSKFAPLIPPYWYVQVQMQLHIADLERVYVAVLMDHGSFTWREVDRDTDLYRALEKLGVIFWREYVETRREPDPDRWYGEIVPGVLEASGSPYGLELLRKLRGSPLYVPLDSGQAASDAVDNAEELVEEYLRLKSEVDLLEERMSHLKKRLESLLEMHGPYRGDGYVLVLEHIRRRQLDRRLLETMVPADVISRAEKEITYKRITLKEEVD